MEEKGVSSIIVIAIVIVITAVGVGGYLLLKGEGEGVGAEGGAAIYIKGNAGFTAENWVVAGSGTENDPYIIENKVINAGGDNGIQIKNTTAHFIIRNCYIHDSHYGIYLKNVRNGRIYNNLVENNFSGIDLYYSDNNTITNNTCENNYLGIGLFESNSNILENNTCSNNDRYGIWLVSSNNNTVINSTYSSNGYYGIRLWENTDNNRIYHNKIVNNTVWQAFDGGTNYWDDGYPSGGNYWNDYMGEDVNGDGIGDTPYYISGDNNRDRYPLMNPI